MKTTAEVFKQGLIAQKKGDLNAAMQLYELVLVNDSRHPDANHNLGQIALTLGQIENAITFFEHALSVNTSTAQYWLSYLDALTQGGYFIQTKKVLKKSKQNGVPRNLLKPYSERIKSSKVVNTIQSPPDAGIEKLKQYIADNNFREGESLASTLCDNYPDHAFLWKSLATCQRSFGKFSESLTSSRKAIQLHQDDHEVHNSLGMDLFALGKLGEAEKSFETAISIKNDFPQAHNNLGSVLLAQRLPDNAFAHFNSAIETQSDYAEARVNLNKLKSELVPFWHVGMMNDQTRNEAFSKAIGRAVSKGDLVLDIGTGSGLLSMMAAKAGAKEIISCEASKIISTVAKKIISKNGFDNQITVVNKMSTNLKVGEDLPNKVDVIISEVLSAELVGEGVRSTILDAKKRLLKKSGKMLPESGDIMIALIGADENITDKAIVDSIEGFDLSDFNKITQDAFTITNNETPKLLSNGYSAFNFDFYDLKHSTKQEHILTLTAQENGQCCGIVQWLKIKIYDDIEYENYPGMSHSHWPNPIFMFDKPIELNAGEEVQVKSTLYEDSLWFSLIK